MTARYCHAKFAADNIFGCYCFKKQNNPGFSYESSASSKIIQMRCPSIYEPRYEIYNNVVCVTSKASDQPAHTHSLIRAFASPLNIL